MKQASSSQYALLVPHGAGSDANANVCSPACKGSKGSLFFISCLRVLSSLDPSPQASQTKNLWPFACKQANVPFPSLIPGLSRHMRDLLPFLTPPNLKARREQLLLSSHYVLCARQAAIPKLSSLLPELNQRELHKGTEGPILGRPDTHHIKHM